MDRQRKAGALPVDASWRLVSYFSSVLAAVALAVCGYLVQTIDEHRAQIADLRENVAKLPVSEFRYRLDALEDRVTRSETRIAGW